MARTYTTKLRGVTKKNDIGADIQEALEAIEEYGVSGDAVELEHEGDNIYDENAIKVYYDGNHIGYIERDMASWLAPIVDEGRAVAALNEIIGGGDGKSYGCKIDITIYNKTDTMEPKPAPVRRQRPTPTPKPEQKPNDSAKSTVKLTIYEADYFKDLSNKEFKTWASQFIAWKDMLPATTDGKLLQDAQKQLQIIKKEITRREQLKNKCIIGAVIIVLAVVFLFKSCSGNNTQKDSSPEPPQNNIGDVSIFPGEDTSMESEELEDPDVPQEYLNALAQAQSYSDNMHMSRMRIFEQLTSEYGGKFPPEAAQYAIDNVEADFNENALETAKSYYENMNMSKEDIRDQLVSAYGERFLEEEADYAIDHLDD